MTKCAVLFCKNYSHRAVNISFHSFPTDPSRKREWVKAVRREQAWIPRKHSQICSLHFEPECYNNKSKKQRKLFKDAVPTLHLPEFSHENKNWNINTSEITKVAENLGADHKPCTPVNSDENGKYIIILETTKIVKNEETDNKPRTPVNLPGPLYNETEIKDSPRIRRLNLKIQEKNRKKLQHQNRGLKKKVAGLMEILRQLNK